MDRLSGVPVYPVRCKCSIRAASELRKMDPTLWIERTLSSTALIGCLSIVPIFSGSILGISSCRSFRIKQSLPKEASAALKTFTPSRHIPLLVLLAVLLTLPACQTLRQIAQLRHVDFAIDRTAQVQLAGLDASRLQSYNDLRPAELIRLGTTVAQGSLPLEFTLHLNAFNPQDNNIAARLVQMDWTLFLEDRETISGRYDGEVLLPPGEVTDIPIHISLDLMDFFRDNMQQLVNVALSATGQDAAPTNLRLQATPTINTSLGPIRYPEAITIVNRDIGSERPVAP